MKEKKYLQRCKLVFNMQEKLCGMTFSCLFLRKLVKAKNVKTTRVLRVRVCLDRFSSNHFYIQFSINQL